MVKVEEIELGLSLSVGGAFKKFKLELGPGKLKYLGLTQSQRGLIRIITQMLIF